MTRRIEELLKVEIPEEIGSGELFEITATDRNEVINGGISMSSGCVSCNNGGNGRIEYKEGKDKTEYEK
ncbi:MAG: hypothetical protein AABW52_05785 [Nanoarchaeota archaeon]